MNAIIFMAANATALERFAAKHQKQCAGASRVYIIDATYIWHCLTNDANGTAMIKEANASTDIKILSHLR
jgi:hypothetical protein